MPFLPLRKIPDCPTRAVATDWLNALDASLDNPAADRALICRETLTALFHPEFAANWETAVEDTSLSLPTRLSLSAMDPRNISLEPEYYSDCDDARFQRVKPLLWLWYSFDRSALGGQNVWLGV